MTTIDTEHRKKGWMNTVNKWEKKTIETMTPSQQWKLEFNSLSNKSKRVNLKIGCYNWRNLLFFTLETKELMKNLIAFRTTTIIWGKRIHPSKWKNSKPIIWYNLFIIIYREMKWSDSSKDSNSISLMLKNTLKNWNLKQISVGNNKEPEITWIKS